MIRLLTRLMLAVSLGAASAAWALTLPGPLVDTGWLQQHLDNPALVILDVRGDRDNFAKAAPAKPNPKGPLLGHIPNARLWDFDRVRETRVVDGVKLDKMAPTPEKFTALMRELGVRNGDAVVVVSNANDTPSLTQATRAYWTLKYFGHDNIAILDGGTSKWAHEGKPLSHAAATYSGSGYAVRAVRNEILASTSDVIEASKGGLQIVDGRTADYYVGQRMTSDVTAKGHIPGARMLAHTELVNDKTNLFKSGDELRRLVQEMGIDPSRPAITYCNTGHLASGPWFVMYELLGNKNAKLYDGSMHEWTKDAARPTSRRWEMN
jgi:thiosulfate/3-mercaptopyruvate sulfurtransferase